MRRLAGAGIVVLAALVAIAPMMVRGPSCGIDFLFHFTSWHDALNSWRQGIVYPHWAASVNFGAGEPRFIFYPPLTWMAGAALGLALPWPSVPVVLSFLVLAASGLATRALALEAVGDEVATLAGCIAIFSGYAQLVLYVRSDFPELAGGIFVPLLLLFLLRGRNPPPPAPAPFWSRTFNGSAVPLALVITATWLTNAPVGLMVCYLLAGVALLQSLLERSWTPIVRAVVAVTLGMGLAAFYLVPAVWEQRWVDLRQAISNPKFIVENRWLFGSLAHPFRFFHSMEPTKKYVAVGAAMFALCFGGLLVGWLRGRLSLQNKPGDNQRIARGCWIPLAAISVVLLFLELPDSLPVWNLLPKLRFLQFPWRWLIVLQAPMAIFFALAIWPARLRSRWLVGALCAVALITVSVASGRSLFLGCGQWDPETPQLSVIAAALDSGGQGVRGVPEYESPGARNSLLPIGLPEACLVADPMVRLGRLDDGAFHPVWTSAQGSCDATFAAADAGRVSSEHLRIAAVVPHAGYLILRLRTYPAWTVTVNGRAMADLPRREDGLMAVPVAQGPTVVMVDWTTTPDVILGHWISLVSALLLAALFVIERKLRQPPTVVAASAANP